MKPLSYFYKIFGITAGAMYLLRLATLGIDSSNPSYDPTMAYVAAELIGVLGLGSLIYQDLMAYWRSTDEDVRAGLQLHALKLSSVFLAILTTSIWVHPSGLLVFPAVVATFIFGWMIRSFASCIENYGEDVEVGLVPLVLVTMIGTVASGTVLDAHPFAATVIAASCFLGAYYSAMTISLALSIKNPNEPAVIPEPRPYQPGDLYDKRH